MKNKLQSPLRRGLLCALLTVGPFAPVAAATSAKDDGQTSAPSVNQIKVGTCEVEDLPDTPEGLVAQERRVGLVMDARPFAINQTFGKNSFNGSAGRVNVLHMNPFVYSYKISVAQKEIVSTALSDFVNLLLPPALGKAVGFQSGTEGVASAKANAVSKLQLIEERLKDYEKKPCAASPDACAAINAMNDAFKGIKNSVLLSAARQDELMKKQAANALPSNESAELSRFESVTSPKLGGTPADDAYAEYTTALAKVRDVEADSYTTCDRATKLNTKLTSFNLDSHFTKLKEAQREISNVTTLVNDLKEMVKTYGADADLNAAKHVPRCQGFNCVGQFDKYADAALEVLGTTPTGYQGMLNRRTENAEEMRGMLRLTEEMKTKEGLFARTFDVPKKFELSEATVSINRTELRPANQTGRDGNSGNQSGSADGDRASASSGGSGGGNTGGGIGSVGTLTPPGGSQSGTAPPTPTPTPAARSGGNSLTTSGQVSENIRIGRPRFALSAGLVYSPLPRRTFETVKGFAKDAQGNPTGDGSANIIGFGENSSRRLLPMVMLNTRLADFGAASVFFTTGVTAKYDDNVDVEYLFGPSVGFLNNRVLFTGGLYGGKTQNLLPDLAVGDVIPDAAGGDAKLFRKTTTWKPGFSVSYFFTRPPKQGSGGDGGGGSTAPAAGVRDEIRIGSIPFNLTVGMIYSTLEQRTYSPVVGFARDRQGDLTNGQTLTRIVGLTSSSDSRLTPAVLLHSRLTNFGRHDFYFSSGITGKKTDNSFDIEYLLGGSVNLYRRKVFLTFGAFAGKQQTLGGGFFEGAALAKTQGVTTQNRYVWKPAISFSYDVTRFIPGGTR